MWKRVQTAAVAGVLICLMLAPVQFARADDAHIGVVLIGSMPDEHPGIWQGPNGERLSAPPVSVLTDGSGPIQLPAGYSVYWLLFDVAGPPLDNGRGVRFDIPETNASYYWWPGRDMKSISPSYRNSILLKVAFPTEKRFARIRVGVAGGDWETVASDNIFRTGGTLATTGKIQGRQVAVAFSPPTNINGKVAFTVADDAGDCYTRIVAVDKTGRTVVPDSYDSGGANQKMEQGTATFGQLKLDDISALRLEARAYSWTEFAKAPLR